jgi:hypothetical protein
VEKRRRRTAVEAEVDWCNYFYTIKPVCPWSYAAYVKGEIAIHKGFSDIFPLDGYQARVYTVKHSPRLCKLHTDRLNLARPHEEWLWSHPSYGNYSTPVPVFIQQDRATLERLRKMVDENKK